MLQAIILLESLPIATAKYRIKAAMTGGVFLVAHCPAGPGAARILCGSRRQQMPHPVVHFEIGCKDSKQTQEFYRSLFDWNITEAGPAAMINAGAGPTGHIS